MTEWHADVAALWHEIHELRFQHAEATRRRAMQVRPGRVLSYDPNLNKALLDVGVETHAVDVGSHVGHWNPLAAGMQVMLLCPDGDLSNGMIVHGGYSEGFAPPSSRADEQALVPPGAGSDEKAAVRIRKGGTVRVEVGDLATFKIIVGEQAFKLKMSALEPTEKD